jgi:hypothetical protein
MDDDTQTSPPADTSIRSFAVKTAIVAVAFLVSAWIVLGQIETLIDTRLEQLREGAKVRASGTGVLHRLEAFVVELAEPSNDLPPERKARLLAAARTLADRWRPLLAELAVDAGTPPPARPK